MPRKVALVNRSEPNDLGGSQGISAGFMCGGRPVGTERIASPSTTVLLFVADVTSARPRH